MTNRYALDARQSRFLVKASVSGMLSALGDSPTIAIRDFSREVQFTVEKPENATLSLATAVGGALKLKDELQCSFDILAQKRQA